MRRQTFHCHRHRGRKRAMQLINSFLSTLPSLLNAPGIIRKILKYIYSSMHHCSLLQRKKKRGKLILK